jgi:leader peptidase (prepilin peptidase)/N-methyltransferase
MTFPNHRGLLAQARVSHCAIELSRRKGLMRALISRDTGANWIAAALIFAAAAASLIVAPGPRGLLGASLALLMGAIAVADFRHFIIPNAATAPALLLGLVHSVFVDPPLVIGPLAFAALRGGILALMFFALREIHGRLRGREGIGLGDVKLAGVAGVWLDWPTIPLAIEAAALAGLAVYLAIKITLGQPMRSTNRLPFGLFLAPAIWAGWVFETMLTQ